MLVIRGPSHNSNSLTNRLQIGVTLPTTDRQDQGSSIKTKALLDSGATTSFMDLTFAQTNKFPLTRLAHSVTVTVANGQTIPMGFECRIQVQIEDHIEELVFSIMPLSKNLFLGFDWLQSVRRHC
jgi:predicted aspartyl protease